MSSLKVVVPEDVLNHLVAAMAARTAQLKPRVATGNPGDPFVTVLQWLWEAKQYNPACDMMADYLVAISYPRQPLNRFLDNVVQPLPPRELTQEDAQKMKKYLLENVPPRLG